MNAFKKYNKLFIFLKKNNFFHNNERKYYKPVIVNNFWINNYIEYKSNGHKNRILSVEEYLDKSRPYLRDIINDLKQSETWKIQLTVTIYFISSKDDNDDDDDDDDEDDEDDDDEERVMHSKSDNIKIMISYEADEVIKKLFDPLKNRYQNNLQSMRGREYFFDYVINRSKSWWIIYRFS